MPTSNQGSRVPGPKLLRPFVDAIRLVFHTMTGVDPVAGRPHTKRAAIAPHGICGVIIFHGQVVGSVTVRFSESAAEGLVEAFTGTKMTRAHPDFADAIGELANMVAGAAKRNLNRVASISPPRVTLDGYAVTVPADLPCLVIPCRCPHGVFTVEVSLRAAALAA